MAGPCGVGVGVAAVCAGGETAAPKIKLGNVLRW